MEFSVKDRMIFPYYNGAADVFGDPLDIHDKLTDLLDGDPQTVISDTITPGTKDADGKELPGQPDSRRRFEAKRRVDAAVIEAFGMIPFDPTTGNGSNRHQRTTALNAFCAWMNGAKKNSVAPPILPAGDCSLSPAPIMEPSSVSG